MAISVSDISNATETRCDEGELSKVGIEPTLPHLFFILFVAHFVFLGRLLRNFYCSYELNNSQLITKTKMSKIVRNRKCRGIFAGIRILESYCTFG